MPNRLPLIAVVFLFWATSSGAAEPTSAEGVYALRRPETLLAFRVDPWSERMHQIRGIGRVTIDGKEPTDVYFEILGTYRPSRSHEARGVLLYRDSKSTSSIPWQGREPLPWPPPSASALLHYLN